MTFPARCKYCNGVFNDKRGLAWHFQKKHPEIKKPYEPHLISLEFPENEEIPTPKAPSLQQIPIPTQQQTIIPKDINEALLRELSKDDTEEDINEYAKQLLIKKMKYKMKKLDKKMEDLDEETQEKEVNSFKKYLDFIGEGDEEGGLGEGEGGESEVKSMENTVVNKLLEAVMSGQIKLGNNNSTPKPEGW